MDYKRFKQLKEGDKIKLVAKTNVFRKTWDEQDTEDVTFTKGKEYDAVIARDLGVLVIKTINNLGRESYMDFGYAEDIMEIFEGE